MIRIRGTVGDLAVDLTVEMDASDWANLGAQLEIAPQTVAPPSPDAGPAPGSRVPNDAPWIAALALLERVGRIDGPQLLEQVEALAGSTAAGKRLLVRLRHCAQVRVESGADAPVYCWVG